MKKLFSAFMVLMMAPLAQACLTPTKYITFQGKQIAIYESTGLSLPAFFIVHGNTSSAESFQTIMQSSFAKQHRVILMDLPGNGLSENAAAYTTAYVAQAVAFAALNTTYGRNAIFVGWSLGGDLLLQAQSLLPEARGFVFAGTAPLGYRPDLPPPFLTPQQSYAGDAVNFGFIPNLTRIQLNQYVKAFFRPNYAPIPIEFSRDAYRTDPAFRAAIGKAATGQDATFKDEIQIIKALKKPVALLVGNFDFVVNKAFMFALAKEIPMLYRKQIFITNTGHAIQHEDPKGFMAFLQQFKSEVH